MYGCATAMVGLQLLTLGVRLGRRPEDRRAVGGSPSAAANVQWRRRYQVPLTGTDSRRVIHPMLYCLLWMPVVFTLGSLFYLQRRVWKTGLGGFGYRDVSVSSLHQRPSTKLLANRTVPRNCSRLEDIQNLIHNRTLNLEASSMNTSETIVFGTVKSKVLGAVKVGNQRIERARKAKVLAREPILETLSSLEMTMGNYSYLPGGHWKPAHCSARWKVAILIPYRNRRFHLPILLRHLVPMLQKQLLHFAIYLVNQENDLRFNRAMLFNVGFLEALNFTNWDCFVLHDVDHVPLSERNFYGCDDMPRHLYSGSDRTRYKLPYRNNFGAVVGLTRDNIQTINGFPNVYWGWGAEDDDIFLRVVSKFQISRTEGPVGYYRVITHHHKRAPEFKDGVEFLRSSKSRFATDGLNNLKYRKPHVELHPLYTNISVDIQKL